MVQHGSPQVLDYRSSDYSVGSGQQVWWHCYPDLLGGFEIDHKFKFRRPLYWDVRRLGAFEYLVDHHGRARKARLSLHSPLAT
jgi:hypothetical protein